MSLETAYRPAYCFSIMAVDTSGNVYFSGQNKDNNEETQMRTHHLTLRERIVSWGRGSLGTPTIFFH